MRLTLRHLLPGHQEAHHAGPVSATGAAMAPAGVGPPRVRLLPAARVHSRDQHPGLRQGRLGGRQMRKPMLAAFDFDDTLVDGDGLQALIEVGAGHCLPNVKSTYTFSLDALSTTQRMIRDMQKNKGVTAEDMRLAIQKIPLNKGLDDVLRLLKSHDCEVIIISDMMSVTINDWISGSEISSLVDKVYTNPAYYDSEGLMVIEPYHQQDWCDKSFKSLCKGHVLDEHIKNRLAEGVSFDTVAFFGDGRNDLCPLLRLAEKDLAFPREGFRLMELLKTEAREQVKAAVHPWCCGKDIIEVLKPYLQSSN